MKSLMKRLNNEQGQGLTEYLILLLLVSVVSIAAVKSLGGTIKSKLGVVRDHVNKDVSLED
jgi:Flp pilus assembly pilin Flp